MEARFLDTIQATSSEETTVLKWEEFRGKWQFLDLDTSASNTTELDPYKFTHFLLEVVRSMGSFGFQIWLERRSSRVSVFYFRSRKLQFGASVDVGRENFSLQARGSTNQ